MTIRFPENPKVSIITSCRNCETVLENTIKSVIQQSYQNIEYIIVDGNSMDGTLDVIKRYEDSITKWICEPDKGVYDGMNKGIIHSTGEILYFLNAGDYFYNDKVIEAVVENFSDSVFAVYGNVEVFNEHRKKKLIRGCRVTPNKLLYRHICHQALFVRRCLFEEIGMYSDSFKLAADHDFIVKAMIKYPGNFLYLNEVLAVYRDGGMSCKMMDRMKIEELKILSSNYNTVQYIFGTAVCTYVVLRYKIPYYLGFKSARFE